MEGSFLAGSHHHMDHGFVSIVLPKALGFEGGEEGKMISKRVLLKKYI